MHCVAPLHADGIPLPAHIAAIWGGFIYEGLLASVSQDQGLRERRILDAWDQGRLELVTTACTHLPEVWAQITETWSQEEADFPGVFEYEVVSALGVYLGDYLLGHDGTMPEPVAVQAEIQRLIAVFFAGGRSVPVLHAG